MGLLLRKELLLWGETFPLRAAKLWETILILGKPNLILFWWTNSSLSLKARPLNAISWGVSIHQVHIAPDKSALFKLKSALYFSYFSWKHMLWVLIRGTLVMHWEHDICFPGEKIFTWYPLSPKIMNTNWSGPFMLLSIQISRHCNYQLCVFQNDEYFTEVVFFKIMGILLVKKLSFSYFFFFFFFFFFCQCIFLWSQNSYEPVNVHLTIIQFLCIGRWLITQYLSKAKYVWGSIR